MAANLSTQSAAVRAMIESIARQVAKDEIAAALRNLRPGGLVPYACTLEAPVASLTVPACHIDVPFPGFLHRITVRSHVVGSLSLDLWKRRPTQVYAEAAGILGTDFPTVVGLTDAEFPVQLDWTPFVEADSTLYFFLRTVSGYATGLTINVWLRATSGAA